MMSGSAGQSDGSLFPITDRYNGIQPSIQNDSAD